MSNRAQNALVQDSNLWLLKRNIRGFCNLAQDSSFYQGVRSMIQAAGIGKLRPNIVMLGFKTNWKASEPGEVADYFKTIQYAFDIC